MLHTWICLFQRNKMCICNKNSNNKTRNIQFFKRTYIKQKKQYYTQIKRINTIPTSLYYIQDIPVRKKFVLACFLQQSYAILYNLMQSYIILYNLVYIYIIIYYIIICITSKLGIAWDPSPCPLAIPIHSQTPSKGNNCPRPNSSHLSPYLFGWKVTY